MKDGEPAFPRASTYEGAVYEAGHAGMTLRDWFAGQVATAMIGAVADGEYAPDFAIAKRAYAFADAMLLARGMPEEDLDE